MITATSNWQLKLERPVIVFFYRVFAQWAGRYKILLLTTTGRKSHRKRTVPVVFMPVSNSFVVVAANVGSDVQPGWFLNLRNDPHAHIQISREKMSVLAEEAPAQNYAKLWADWLRDNPGYQTFQAKTARKFPIVILKPATPSN
jgi:F420H(2)-dependent quinone reductase